MHRETRISNYFLAAFSALSLTMLSLPLSAPVRAFKACAVYILDPIAFYGAKGVERISDVPPGVSRLLSADMENVRLQAELRNTAWLKAELDGLRTENRRLTQALGLKLSETWEPLWADVMERDPLHWYNSIMISAGSDQGVTLNAPVFGDRGGTLAAVGRITEVRKDSAMVLLVTDELSSVAAYLSTAAVEGLVQGQGGSRLRMNYLHSEAVLTEGDLVYTSPTSATFPGEILIGRVAAVNPRDPFLTFQSVEVIPAIDAASLSHVMLLKPSGAAGQVHVTPLPEAAPPGERAAPPDAKAPPAEKR
jgi:rod shape-determining protein MreC